jgi:phosphoglycerol transferase MdoB-like AlkP superfamily enzyme
MTNQAKQPYSIPFSVLLAGCALMLWLMLRVILWVNTGPSQMSLVQASKAFGLGLWFDIGTLAFIAVPFLAMSAFYPNRWRSSPVARKFYWVAAWLVLAILMFGVVSEIVFWEEFSTRFNFIAVDYLIYTNEVIGNILESYPVGLMVAGIVLAALAAVALLSRYIRPAQSPLSLRQRASMLLLACILPASSWFLVDVDQMLVTGNAYADEMAGNGLFTLAAAMRRNELDYDRFYKTIPQERADNILASVGVSRTPLSQAIVPKEDEHEPEELGPFRRNPRNVVLISVESLSARYLGAYGNNKGLTPNLDRLATEGLKFERVFATGTRTVRGLDALSLGAPPIPGQAIIRRQHNEHLATIGEMLEQQGYATFFFYGGYGYFDNMNAYFRANDYRVVDRTDFPEKSVVFENIWGVADEVLFDNTLPALDATARNGLPFFAQIMTTSNHRPYTYPDGRIDIPSPGGRSGAVKYTDYAIGRFIEQAKTKPWFKDTLFVIVADHCASVAGKTKLPMDRYHIPLIFYAPDMLKPGVYKRMASQIDIAPTLLDLLGKKGDDHFFGQSMFEAAELPERVFISNYQQLGYYKDGVLTVLSPKQHVEAFRIDPRTYASTFTAVDESQANEAIAFYQTASRAFKHGSMHEPTLNAEYMSREVNRGGTP